MAKDGGLSRTSKQYIAIPRHPVVPNPHMLLTSIPTESKFVTVIDLCSVKIASIFLLSLGKDGKIPGQ